MIPIPPNMGDLGALQELANVLLFLGENRPASEHDGLPDPYLSGFAPTRVGEWLQELCIYLSETGLTMHQLREQLGPVAGKRETRFDPLPGLDQAIRDRLREGGHTDGITTSAPQDDD